MLNQILERVLGEVEKNRFTTLPGKGGHSGLALSKNCLSQPGRFGGEVYSNGLRMELLIRLECVQGLHSFNLALGGLLTSFEVIKGSLGTSSIWWGF